MRPEEAGRILSPRDEKDVRALSYPTYEYGPRGRSQIPHDMR